MTLQQLEALLCWATLAIVYPFCVVVVLPGAVDPAVGVAAVPVGVTEAASKAGSMVMTAVCARGSVKYAVPKTTTNTTKVRLKSNRLSIIDIYCTGCGGSMCIIRASR